MLFRRLLTVISIFIIILLLSIIIRFYPLISTYSAHPADFSGPESYNIGYILDTGHLVKNHDVQTFSNFGATIYSLVDYPMLSIFRVSAHIVTCIPLDSWEWFMITSFFISIAFSLILLSLYSHQRENFNTTHVAMIILFSLLGTPTIIYGLIPTNAAFGWLFISLCVLQYMKHNNPKRRFLLLFFSLFLIFLYYTPSIIYFIFLTVLLTYQYMIKRKDYPIIIVVFYFVSFVSYSIYIGTDRFNATTHLLPNIYELIKTGITGVVGGSHPESDLYSYLITTSNENKVKRLINAFFVSIPFIYFVFIGSGKIKNARNKDILWSLSLSLIPLGIMLALWMGIWGIWRLAEWGGLFSLIIFSLMIGDVSKKGQKILIFSVVIAVLTSSYAYISDENIPTNRITYTEDYNIHWITRTTSNEDVIFTDLRLAGALIGEGHFRVVGLHEKKENTSTLINLYKEIYLSYDDDDVASEVKRALSSFKTMGREVDYIFLSEQMMKMPPGIRVYNYTLKPPTKNITFRYDNLYSIYKIYDNGLSKIYST